MRDLMTTREIWVEYTDQQGKTFVNYHVVYDDPEFFLKCRRAETFEGKPLYQKVQRVNRPPFQKRAS